MEGLRTGTVKFWHDVKGYAILIDDETKKEYYTYKKLLAEGETRLVGNEKVQYELKKVNKETPNGHHAINVKSIN